MIEREKLAILIPNLSGGGAERIVSLLIKEWCQRYEIHLCLFSQQVEYDIPKEVTTHILLPNKVLQNTTQFFLHLPLLMWRYSRLCKKIGVQRTLSLMHWANYVNVLSKWFRQPGNTIISERIASHQEYRASTWQNALQRKMIKWLYPKANQIITISKGLAADLHQYFAVPHNKLTPIHNPIDLDYIEQRRHQPLAKHFDTFSFIAIGRLNDQKDFPTLIRAFGLLQDQYKKPAKLYILGKGELETSLKAQAKQHGLEQHIIFLGFQTNPFSYLTHSDCFILSSTHEGFGNVFTEALACELPVIATDCNHGPREILAPELPINTPLPDTPYLGKHGILTPVKDETGLAQAMNEIIENAILRDNYHQLAASRAKDFSITATAKAYETVIFKA